MTEQHDDHRHPAEAPYRWYTWDAPIGLGLFLVCLALVAVLARLAIVGL